MFEPAQGATEEEPELITDMEMDVPASGKTYLWLMATGSITIDGTAFQPGEIYESYHIEGLNPGDTKKLTIVVKEGDTDRTYTLDLSADFRTIPERDFTGIFFAPTKGQWPDRRYAPSWCV